MGKATVVQALGAGEYVVSVDTGTEQKEAEVSRLTALVADLTARIASWQQTLTAFEEQEEAPARAAGDAAQTAYIEAMRGSPPPDAATIRTLIEAHSQAIQALFGVRARAALLRLQLDTWRFELAQAKKDLARWQSAETEFELSTWCADYTADAAGEVSTVEAPGEFGPAGTVLVIAPQDVPPTLPAGAIVSREVQTGAQAYLNAALLPGWQKHMPTYRAGVITSLNRDADTARVALEEDRSSAQNLRINQSDSLSDVPVRYMTCNASAFEVGDRVIVEFQQQDWTKPVVIGFVERPRPCKLIAIGYVSSRWGMRGSPADPEYDEALLPHRARWAQYDPASGEITNATVLDISYAFSTWQNSPPESCAGTIAIADNWYSCMTQQFWLNPIAFGKKAWMRRMSSFAGDAPRALVAHDGEAFVTARNLYAVSALGGNIIGADTADSQTLVVLDPASNQVVKEHKYDGVFVYDTEAHGHLAVLRVESAEFNWNARVRVVDTRTWAILADPEFNPEFAVIADVAVSQTHFAALVYVGEYRSIRVFDISSGEMLDEVSAPWARSINMSGQYLVSMFVSDLAGDEITVSDVGVNVYQVTESGLVAHRSDYPFVAQGE